MNKSTLRGLFSYSLAIFSLVVSGCRSSRGFRTSVVTPDSYHSSYDEATLALDDKSVMMPYNRFIDPAGTVIRFGNPALENHSLDCVLIPGGKVLAVEDRYGLAFMDVENKKLLFHLDYDGNYKGLMSTFSGVKVWEEEKSIHIFWGASNPA